MDHKLTPFQQQIFDRFNKADIRYTAGRRMGKSTINQYINQWHSMQESQQPKYKIISNAEVDGKTWYTISCHKEVSMWIRKNGVENDSWFEHIDGQWTIFKNMFDVSEELYLMLVLKFGQ